VLQWRIGEELTTMFKTSSGISFVAVAMLIGCAAPQPSPPAEQAAAAAGQAVALGAADVHALYGSPHQEDGVVLHGAHAGAHWTKWTKPDGTVELTAAHGLFTDKGRFVIRGNEVCYTWQHIDGGRQTCVHLAKVGADEYLSYASDGTEGSRFRVSVP
jgi:hypothetical protein